MDRLMCFIYPLAKASNVGEMGSFSKIFTAIRHEALSSVDTYVSAVLVIVSLILVFKLVKMSYTVMSDEQHAGFGGVRLWDILRPLLIVLVIQNCGYFVGLLDSGVSAVTAAFFNKVNENVVVADTGAEITTFEIGNRSIDISTREGQAAAGEAAADANGLNSQIEALEQARTDLESRLESGGGASFYLNSSNAEILQQKAAIELSIRELKERKKSATEALAEYVDCQEELSDPRSRLAVWSQWIYERLVFVMICITDMILCCFIVFAPLVFALSLIDRWRDALMNWVAGYIQVSLWKVTIAVINWIVGNSRTVALAWIRNENLASFTGFAANGSDAAYVNSGVWLVVGAVLSMAGILCVLMAPTITHMVLSLGSAPSDVQAAAKTEMMAPVSAARGAASLAGKVFGK